MMEENELRRPETRSLNIVKNKVWLVDFWLVTSCNQIKEGTARKSGFFVGSHESFLPLSIIQEL